MSKETFVLVPNGEAIYAVPTDVCVKYELEGEKLDGAKTVLAKSESDVEGQGVGRTDQYGRYYYDSGYGDEGWVRQPWMDK